MQESAPEPEESAIKKNFLLLHVLEDRGMSHSKLARKTGMDAKWITELEDGNITLTYTEAEILGKTLRVNPRHLYLYSLQLSKLRTGMHIQMQNETTSLKTGNE